MYTFLIPLLIGFALVGASAAFHTAPWAEGVMVMVKDPVCGMEVDEQTAPFHTHWEHAGTFYFCSEHCKKVFDEGPEAEEAEKMSRWQRFLKRLGDASQKRYAGKPPSCH